MSISKKLAKALLEEGLGGRRLKPAKIITARGVTIEADHARIVRHPQTGTKILIMGIGHETERVIRRYQAVSQYKASLTGSMRDFTAPGEYIPAPTMQAMIDMWRERGIDRPWQDESGWSHPDSTGGYDVHRNYLAKRKFEKILTAFVYNIKSIKWIKE